MKIKPAVSVLLCMVIMFIGALTPCLASPDGVEGESKAEATYGLDFKDFINNVVKEPTEESDHSAVTEETESGVQPLLGDVKENAASETSGIDNGKNAIKPGEENLKGLESADENVDVLDLDAPAGPEEDSPFPEPAPMVVVVEDTPNPDAIDAKASVQEPSTPEEAAHIERVRILKAKNNPNWANLFAEGVEPSSEPFVSDGGDTLAIIVSDKRAEVTNTADSLDGVLLVFDKAGTQLLQVPSKEEMEKKEGIFTVHTVEKISPNGKYLAVSGSHMAIRFYNLTNLKFWDVSKDYKVNEITDAGVAEVSYKRPNDELEYVDLTKHIGD